MRSLHALRLVEMTKKKKSRDDKGVEGRHDKGVDARHDRSTLGRLPPTGRKKGEKQSKCLEKSEIIITFASRKHIL